MSYNKSIMNKNILVEYYNINFNQYLDKSLDKVTISNLDLTIYIGKDTDSVLLDLTEKLLEKYKIFDCRQMRWLEAYSHSVDIYSDKDNKVTKIKYEITFLIYA